MVFTSCATQWRISPGGGVMGLEYASAHAVMGWLKIQDPADCFQRVQVMESETVSAFAQQARAEKARAFHHGK